MAGWATAARCRICLTSPDFFEGLQPVGLCSELCLIVDPACLTMTALCLTVAVDVLTGRNLSLSWGFGVCLCELLKKRQFSMDHS